MPKENASVSGDEQAAKVSEETQADQKGVSKETPDQSPGDGEAKLIELQRQYEEKLEKFQQDINRMKSNSQKKEFELSKQLEKANQELERYERQLLSVMDDDARAEYENATRASRFQDLEAQAQQAERALQEQQALDAAFYEFARRGVPYDVLLEARPDGTEALAGAAWDWLFNKVNSSEAPPQDKPRSTKPEEPPTAPDVVTDTSDVPSDGPDWKELKEKFGNEEAVWMAVEQGSLSPEAIPEFREAKKSQS